jgi:hypothetical protein
LIPGVGAIYNAEYFKAAAHIIIFGVLFQIGAHAPGPAEPIFMLLTFGFYMYMPFEAYYTARKRKLGMEGVNLETPIDTIQERLAAIKRKDLWGGITLIVIGGIFLLDNFNILEIGNAFRLWPIALIAAGIWLLRQYQNNRTVE